jgi:Ca2+-binding EF-hand superfamily protein
MDANKNGMIEPGEMSERSSRFLQRAADQAGLKAGEPWPVEKLLGGMSRRDDNNSSSSSTTSSSGEKPRTDGSPTSTITASSGTTSPSATSAAPAASSSGSALPKVPILGFGEKDGGIKIPTFAPAPLGGVAPVAAGGTTQYDERIVSRVNDMLKEADTNRNGYLDADEIRAYRNWSTPPEESDLDKDGRLSRTELLERLAKRYASRGSRSDSSSRGSQSQPVDTAAQSRKYAEGLMQKYDGNKSGYLEKDEWKELKPEYQAADINKDGVISTDELVTRLNALNSGQGGTSASSSVSSNSGSGYSRYGNRDRGSDRDRGGRSSDKDKDAKKPLIRALTPTERLPKGLPDWFLRNDADADGQVSMVEYAAAWSEKTAAEFQKYDLNQDGIITADEVLTVDKDSKSTTRSR